MSTPFVTPPESLYAWTRAADRHTVAYRNLTILGGFATGFGTLLAARVFAVADVWDALSSDRHSFITAYERQGRQASERFMP